MGKNESETIIELIQATFWNKRVVYWWKPGGHQVWKISCSLIISVQDHR